MGRGCDGLSCTIKSLTGKIYFMSLCVCVCVCVCVSYAAMPRVVIANQPGLHFSFLRVFCTSVVDLADLAVVLDWVDVADTGDDGQGEDKIDRCCPCC